MVAVRVAVLGLLFQLLLDPVLVLEAIGLGQKMIVQERNRANDTEKANNAQHQFNFFSICPLIAVSIEFRIVLKKIF
jgi:hypothetical protein